MNNLEGWHYIALLGAVIVVFAFLIPKQTQQSSKNSTSKDELEQMELSLGQFMDNMEKQHDELVQVLSTSINQLKDDNRQQAEYITVLEKRCLTLEDHFTTISHTVVALETKYQLVTQSDVKLVPTSTKSTEAVETHLSEKNSNENSIHTRYAELFELYEAGKSIEYIAKKIGKNKGEVQLIIQLAKQEEKIQHG